VANVVCQLHHFARRATAEMMLAVQMAGCPIHSRELLAAVRRRENARAVDGDLQRVPEVWGVPVGVEGEPRRHGRMGRRRPQVRPRVIRPQVIIPRLRDFARIVPQAAPILPVEPQRPEADNNNNPPEEKPELNPDFLEYLGLAAVKVEPKEE